jgi:anti-anti-sigma regulatory factor
LADEDSFSLDFTAPGVLPPVPPAPPPEPAAKLVLELVPNGSPATAAPPAAAPVAPSPPPVPVVPGPLLEAAELHASGDYLAASKKLEALLKTGGKLGPFTDAAWQGLFEVLHDLKRRDTFDKLALTYAQHFEKSPPTWVEEEPAHTDSAASDVATCTLPASLDAAIGPVLKDMMQTVRPNQQLEIGLGAIQSIDDAGATLLMRALKALDGAKHRYVLAGAEHLAKRLGETLEPMDRAHEPQWLLLISLFDHLDQQDAFEDAAVNYAVTFEVSPPSWETRVRTTPRLATQPTPAGATDVSGPPALRGEVLGACTALIQQIEACADNEIVLDATKLKRIDIAAADTLLGCLKARHDAGTRITVSNVPPLPLILLSHHGWAPVATLKPQKV